MIRIRLKGSVKNHHLSKNAPLMYILFGSCISIAPFVSLVNSSEVFLEKIRLSAFRHYEQSAVGYLNFGGFTREAVRNAEREER